ncbi:hypothetical protein BJ875DRAFT_480342 [Amylocarpus encephaloides]|uniref:Uncharacterized protein n=1 Tax=Amylocarpus encephaloides TaxID=45428 RepID=A0A9P7YRA3_9HELO|nr:hypothetical protein BJ875DRAFT_480342 [Amylocarpus encephaloides]
MTSHKIPNDEAGGPDRPPPPTAQEESAPTPTQPQEETSDCPTLQDTTVIPQAESGVSVTQSQNSGQEVPGSHTETVPSPAAPNSTPAESPPLTSRSVVFRHIEERDTDGSVTVTEEKTTIAPDGHRYTTSNVVRTTPNGNATSRRFDGRGATRAPGPTSESQPVQRPSTRSSNDTRRSRKTRTSNHTRRQTQTATTRSPLPHPITSVAHLRVSGQQFTAVQLMTVVDQFQDPDMPISTFLDLISEEVGSGRMVAGDGTGVFKFDPYHPGNIMRGRAYEGYERGVSLQELINNWYGYTPVRAWY